MIRLAAGRLRGHWYQGGLDDGRGNRCGMGHLLNVLDHLVDEAEVDGGDRRTYGEMYAQTRRAMDQAAWDKFPDRVGQETGSPFVLFNDHPLTSERDVVAVMELAATRWAVEHQDG